MGVYAHRFIEIMAGAIDEFSNTVVFSKVRGDDYLYREALSWMYHRYAIGITEYLSRSGQSEAERYRLFRDIEFDTEEFHALVRHCNKTITTSHDTATATLSSEAVHTNGPHPRTAAASGKTRRHPVPGQSSPKTW